MSDRGRFLKALKQADELIAEAVKEGDLSAAAKIIAAKLAATARVATPPRQSVEMHMHQNEIANFDALPIAEQKRRLLEQASACQNAAAMITEGTTHEPDQISKSSSGK